VSRPRKVALSLSTESLEAIEREVRARRVPSVSAFVSQAIEEKLAHGPLQRLLDEVWREKPMTDQERRWADRILRA